MLTRQRIPRAGLLVIGSILAAVVVLVVLMLGGSPAVHHPRRVVSPKPPPRRQPKPCVAGVACPPTTAPRFFSPDSLWNRPVPAAAPLDPNTTAIVGDLLAQERSEALGMGAYGLPIYTVGPHQATTHVALLENNPVLQQALATVPIPADARPGIGTDSVLAVYQPSSDTMWEFWHMSRQGAGWQADWGGRMMHVSTNPGYYQHIITPSGQVLEQPSWGAPATSLPLVGGVMTIAELQAGHIDHALGLAITHTRAGVWAAPAQRTDGDAGGPDVVPEGAHFRLDPNLDLASLHLPHFTLMMAEAAQKYGIIINNRSSGFTFRVQDPTQYVAQHGVNPYMGADHQPGTPGALFNEWPAQLLRTFPWSHLQLLKMTLRTEPDRTAIVATP